MRILSGHTSHQMSAVLYYEIAATASLASVQIPMLDLYGGEDARVGATAPPADSAMKALGKRFEHHTFADAGHEFLRQQEGAGGPISPLTAGVAADYRVLPLHAGPLT